jgi:deoxyribose-phosphate aldolase
MPGRTEAELDSLIRQVRARLGLGGPPDAQPFTPADSSAAGLARLIDHTLLKQDATPDQVTKLCDEARRYSFAAVCINPTHVKLAARLLKGSSVEVCTVAGFPLGATLPAVKAYEAQQIIAQGAHEVDMVINIGALKAGDYGLVKDDIAGVVQACRAGKAVCKVIIETAFLTDEEKVAACLLAQSVGADFVKTSTGFGPAGATVEDVALMRRSVGPALGVKAAGGIRDLAAARAMVQAGATRIGASASVKIMQEAGDEKSTG